MHVSATHIVTVLLFCSACAAEPNCGFGISKGVHILRLLGNSKFDIVNTTRHVCLSVRMEPLDSHRTDFDETW
jgi:glutaredoxin-related protein